METERWGRVYRCFLTTLFLLCWVASAGAGGGSDTAQVYYGSSEYVTVFGETLEVPEFDLDGETLALEMDGFVAPYSFNHGVFFEFDELTPLLTDGTVTLSNGATISAIVVEPVKEFVLVGVGMHGFIESYVTLYGGSRIVVDGQGGSVRSYGVALNEIGGSSTAAVLLDEASTISSKATASGSDSGAYAYSYGVSLQDDVHAKVSVDGGSSIMAESYATSGLVVDNSSYAEAAAYGVYADYSDLVEVSLAGGSTIVAKAKSELDGDVEEIDGYTSATSVGIAAYGETVAVTLAEASRVDVEAVGLDEAEATGLDLNYQGYGIERGSLIVPLQVDLNGQENGVSHGEVTLDGASSVIAKATATGLNGSAGATGVSISAQGDRTAVLSLANGSRIYAEANGSDGASAYGANIYSSPNVDVDLLSGSSIEAKATVTADSGYLVGLAIDEAETVNVLLDEGSFIKATGVANDDGTYADPVALAVSSVTDLTLRLQDSSQLIARHTADGTEPYPYAEGLSIYNVNEADVSLTGGSTIIASSVAVGDTFDETRSWGVDAYAIDNLSIRLVGSTIDARATSNGEESNDAFAYGIEVDEGDGFTLSLDSGSAIIAAASTTGMGESVSYGVYLDSVVNAEINVDRTSLVSGDWAVYDEDQRTALNNAGTVAGRVAVSTLNNSATGVLQATFSSADVELNDDNIHYFVDDNGQDGAYLVMASMIEEPSADTGFYFMTHSATLVDGTTFVIVPTDNLGLAVEGNSENYALLVADGEGEEGGGSWSLDQLNVTSDLHSPLFGLELNEALSDNNQLILTATFLTPEQARLSPNATRAYRAAVADGRFTFASTPEEWAPNVSGAFVAGMTQSVGTSYFNIGNRLGSLMGLNSGDEVIASNGMWFSVRFTDAEQDKRDGIEGFDSDTTGLSIGIDREFGDVILGFAYTRGTTDADANDNSADFDMTDNLFSLYGSYDAGAWYTEAILSAGFGSVDGERYLGSDVYESDYDSDSYNAKVEMGMKFNQQGWQINPLIALEYSVKEYDSYTETGSGSMALHVKSEDYSTFTAGLGAVVQKEFQRDWGIFTPELSGRVNYDIENDRIVSTANFVGGSTSFVAKGIEPSETSWDVGGALTIASLGEQNVSFRVGYDYSGRQDFEAHSFTGKLRFEF